MKKVLLLITMIVTPLVVVAQKEPMKEFDSNFAHIVYFWFKNPDNASERAKFEKDGKTLAKFDENLLKK